MSKEYSTLSTPNAKMIENDQPCKADNYPNMLEIGEDKPQIKVTVSSKQINAKWEFPNSTDHFYLIKLYQKIEDFKIVNQFLTKNSYYEFDSIPGRKYKLEISQLNNNKTISTEFKAIFSLEEIDLLYKVATNFVENKMSLATILERCKPSAYFDEIFDHSTKLYNMPPYIKDDNGHKASPINRDIRGTFFKVNKHRIHGTPAFYFGDCCLTLNIEELLDIETTNVYFCDFYCNKRIFNRVERPHFVTLVLCEKNSSSDLFCQDHLKQLDIFDNPFLMAYSQEEILLKSLMKGNSFKFYVNQSVKIELLCTINLEFSADRLRRIESTGDGTSNKKGLEMNEKCEICNI